MASGVHETPTTKPASNDVISWHSCRKSTGMCAISCSSGVPAIGLEIGVRVGSADGDAAPVAVGSGVAASVGLGDGEAVGAAVGEAVGAVLGVAAGGALAV
jgi:hypothetical protein